MEQTNVTYLPSPIPALAPIITTTLPVDFFFSKLLRKTIAMTEAPIAVILS